MSLTISNCKVSERNFQRNNNFITEIAIIDGISRSGKGMIAHVISSFKRVEKQRNDEVFEYIPLMYGHGKITEDAACAILRTQGDTCHYNNLIGRDVNFRPSDDTGVFKNVSFLKYLTRLFLPAGDAAIIRAKNSKPIFQNCVHDTIRYAEILFKAFDNRLKMIYIMRHPVDLIFEWQNAGFGQRIGSDPREFQYTFQWNNNVIAHAAKGWEEEYVRISAAERVVALIDVDLDYNLGHYEELPESQKDSIFLLNFENFVTNPKPYCNKLASFLGTVPTKKTNKILKWENCPRSLTKEEYNRRRQIIKSKVSRPYAERIEKIIKKYERLLSLPPLAHTS